MIKIIISHRARPFGSINLLLSFLNLNNGSNYKDLTVQE